jgi:hypothetical protein
MNCKKIVQPENNYCPECYWAINLEDSEKYLTKLKVDLDEIIYYWRSTRYYIEQSHRFSGFIDIYQKACCKLIDLGHKPNNETTKRNLDLGELTGTISAQICISGFCLGLEYGSKNLQKVPIRNIEEVPNIVLDFFLITFFQTNELHSRLISDIEEVGAISEEDLSKIFEDYVGHFLGFMLTLYKFGLSTYIE